MGIYSDYGRFMKAREFKNWCNSGAGIWFAFSTGASCWDETGVDGTKTRPFVPPSSPAAYTPLYRWFESYKGSALMEQEMALLDRSQGSTLNPPTWPDNTYMENNKDSFPDDDYSPAYCFYDDTAPFIKVELWDGNITKWYPSSHIPVFSVGYKGEWGSYCSAYHTSPFSPDAPEPTNESEYDAYAHKYHIYMGLNKSRGGMPLGLLSMIQGSAHFVELVEEADSTSDPLNNLRIFKYGSHYWRIVQDSQVDENKLPHFVLLTVSVFPNELALSSLVEQMLPVRQVCVFKFPDYLKDVLGLDQSTVPRSSQVLRRENINIVTVDPTTHESSQESTDSSVINIPFNCVNPIDPNNSGSSSYTGNETAELLINDFMTARKRDVQQTDRYGYIIGF